MHRGHILSSELASRSEPRESFFPPSAALPLDPSIRHSIGSPPFSVLEWYSCCWGWAASDLNTLGAEIVSFCVNDNEWGGRGRGKSRKLGLQHNKRSYEIWCYKNSSVGSWSHWLISVVVYDISDTFGESASPVISVFSVLYCVPLSLSWLLQTGTLTPFLHSYTIAQLFPCGEIYHPGEKKKGWENVLVYLLE